MSVNYLPNTVTKEILFKKAQDRFQSWAKLYGDPNISAQYLYEDMSASCYCGCPADDFPELVNAEDNTILYIYDDEGNCSFMIEGIEVEVLDLRCMRIAENLSRELYTNACVLSVTYKDVPGGSLLYHIIPDALLYGSTSEDFNKGHEVDRIFIEAARKYIKQHNITPDMQKED